MIPKKFLKPFEIHLGQGPVIDMNELYYYSPIDESWIMYSDNSGEYKDVEYFSFDAHHVLELIVSGYAEIISIDIKESKPKYHIRMRKHY